MASEGRGEWFATLAEAYDDALAHVTDAEGLGAYEKAIQLYRAMLASLPATATDHDEGSLVDCARADINIWLGNALRIIGLADDAVEAFRAAAAARPDFGDAYWSLANLKTYRFAESEVSAMKVALAAVETTAEDRTQLCFALGKALEDRADYRTSWDYYAQGNALRRKASHYRPEIFETNAAEQCRVCTRSFFEARRGWGDPAKDPIFILGLPRSGSTLIEQILSSHSLVDGTGELAVVQRLVFELQGQEPGSKNSRYPAVLENLSAEDCRRLGDRFLSATSVHRRGRPHFIDKMPNNFHHIGLIALMLPNARIIDARREPLGCCLSNLKQYFATDQEFSYGIEDIARYYRTYLELMRHWDDVLPGKVLRVCHEDLVDDVEAEVRRILNYCDLPFEASCLSFHETKRNVHTPSSEQVRLPINREGLGHWRNFEFALDPLKTALGESVANWRQ